MKKKSDTTLKEFEDEIYKILGVQRYESSIIDHFTLKLCSDYFLFKDKLSDLLENKITFKEQRKHILYNDILFVFASEVYFEYKTTNSLDQYQVGIFWQGSRHDCDMTSNIFPENFNDIQINGPQINAISNRVLKQFLFEDLKKINNKVHKKLLTIENFIIPLDAINRILLSSGIHIVSFFEGNKSDLEIYDILKKNKDLLLLTHDINIEKELNTMEKNYFNKKIGFKLK